MQTNIFLNTSIGFRVKPHALLTYLLATGWERKPSKKGESVVIASRQTPKDVYEVYFSLDPNVFADHEEALERAIIEIARYEATEPETVILMLQNPSDAILFRLVSPETENGTIGLSAGLRLLKNARGLLRAAAYHTGPYPRPERWLRACRLAPVEKESCAFSILCPLFPGNVKVSYNKSMAGISFTRRTLVHLMEALVAIQTDLQNPVLTPPNVENRLLKAVSLMANVSHESYAVEIRPRWFRPTPSAEALPESITFSREQLSDVAYLALRRKTG